VSAALRYHAQTKHSPESVRSGARLLDWRSQPDPLKRYPGLEPLPLPDDVPESSIPATAVLSGAAARDGEAEAIIDHPGLARLLFYSAGITRLIRGMPFRAAMSAGALYPVELYVVCGDLHGLRAGVYHFGPGDFALRQMRDGDHRGILAASAAEPVLGRAPVTLALCGIPWRTSWKYGPRGYRHLFWDAGTVVANLLSLSEAAGLDARVRAAFSDAIVARLLGVDGVREFPLALLELGPAGDPPPEPPPLDELEIPVGPISRREVSYPEITAVHAAGELSSDDDVVRWREAARSLAPAPSASEVLPPESGLDLRVEELILRRGSTRRFRRDPLGLEELDWPLAASSRSVPGDFMAPGASLLERYVCVHDVEGIDPGAYRWRPDGLELLRPGRFRRESAYLCLEQALGGDSAYTVFLCAMLEPLVEALGARGYRAAQLAAGIAAGRLNLAAFALGRGATGLTFYDDEISRFFGTDSSPMLVVAAGAPAYRARPGRRPAEAPRLR
jgi:SagB-type dehydrogenase family enzyme